MKDKASGGTADDAASECDQGDAQTCSAQLIKGRPLDGPSAHGRTAQQLNVTSNARKIFVQAGEAFGQEDARDLLTGKHGLDEPDNAVHLRKDVNRIFVTGDAAAGQCGTKFA